MHIRFLKPNWQILLTGVNCQPRLRMNHTRRTGLAPQQIFSCAGFAKLVRPSKC